MKQEYCAENSGVGSGLHALAMLASFHQIPCDPDRIHHELGIGGRPLTASDLARAARSLGLRTRLLERQRDDRLGRLPLPAIIGLRDGSFALVGRRMDDGMLRVVDPVARTAEHVTEARVAAVWSGTAILLARRPPPFAGGGTFGLAWFLSSLKRYRRPLIDVLATSAFAQICGLATPLLFQVVIDKALGHHGLDTLYAAVVGLLALSTCQSILHYLRGYLVAHTASRIDIELGTRLVSHLLKLPLGWFERRPAGQTVARIRELENVRSFLTGQGLSAVLDLPFALLVLAAMAVYSWRLALVAALSIPCYALIAAGLRPLLRDQVVERFERGAASNQLLVETVVGIQTVKAMAAEPVVRVQWEDRLAAYVRASFRSANLAALGQSAIQWVNRATTAFILLFGARAVMQGDMTVGGLVAFNMLAGQLSAPILRLSQLWQDFQQVKVSIERLADVLDATPEMHAADSAAPPVMGDIRLEGVTFRYNPGSRPVLRDVSLHVPPGQVLGIVGPSGSGKSTITKLVQRLHLAEEGRVLVDGTDVARTDPAWLRRRIGVVLQDTLLFNRTVAENIALADPGMGRERITAAARLAGADAFIQELAQGYATMIEERGANLSGGQRQRIAIARALASNPRILIFDEATSALDYESERAIQDNMRRIAEGRTVIIVAHRLSAVCHCDRIIAMDRGAIVEEGSHRELLQRQSGVYRRLWLMQAPTSLNRAA